FVDPDRTADNLRVTTQGLGVTDLEDLELSMVKPKRAASGAIVPGRADVLVVNGALRGLPKPLTINGSLDLPRSPDDPPSASFTVFDDPATAAVETLGELTATVRNFIAPDPTEGVAVPPRNVGATPTPPDQSIVFIQRGDAFKVDAQIKDVRAAGYRTVRANDTARTPLGTQVVNLAFGKDQKIRAFADIQKDAVQRILADVLLEEVPANVSLCFRGPLTPAQAGKTAVSPTFCDGSGVEDSEGGFSFESTPKDPASSGLDVDAFFRVLGGGGTSLLAGRVNIDNIPQIVQGTFPGGANAGDLDVRGLRPTTAGPVPDGIDEIGFELSSFDIDDPGYAPADIPSLYAKRSAPAYPSPSPFLDQPAPPAGQYVHAALKGSNFRVRGRVGLTNGPSSQLKRLLVGSRPCGAGDFPVPLPAQYPRFPTNDNGQSTYTCVGADFVSSVSDALDVDVYKVDGQEVLRLRNAGLTDVPDWVRVTLSKTEVDDGSAAERWRRPCGAQATEGNANDCMP
ncbi:MAG: hypothetical protein KY447_09760, partial [Actinobacteria bacterium]|nr:hypothetical protein [Actinomycetota bacterium]